MPRLCHQAEHRPEQARQDAAIGEQRIEACGFVNAMLSRRAKRPPQAGEDGEVDGRDYQQEQRRH